MDINEFKKSFKLPRVGHIDCGKESYSFIRPAKKGFYWHCPICGESRFLRDPQLFECEHPLEWKTCKNGFLTAYCALCGIRIFRRPIKSKGGDNNHESNEEV